MFNIAGDPNPRQNLAGQPMLGFVIGLLFLTGVVLLMRRREKLFSRILLIWLAALLLPAIFSSGSPNALRTAGALPAAMLIAAFGADDLWLAGKTFFPTRLRSALIFTAAVILVVLPLLVGYDYFFRFARSPLTAPAFYGYIWQIADFIKSTPPDVHLYIIDNVRRSYSSGTEVANQSIVYALQNEEIASRITYLSVGQTSDLPSGEERAQVIPLDPTPPILYYLGSSLLNFKQTTSNGIIIFTNY